MECGRRKVVDEKMKGKDLYSLNSLLDLTCIHFTGPHSHSLYLLRRSHLHSLCRHTNTFTLTFLHTLPSSTFFHFPLFYLLTPSSHITFGYLTTVIWPFHNINQNRGHQFRHCSIKLLSSCVLVLSRPQSGTRQTPFSNTYDQVLETIIKLDIQKIISSDTPMERKAWIDTFVKDSR